VSEDNYRMSSLDLIATLFQPAVHWVPRAVSSVVWWVECEANHSPSKNGPAVCLHSVLLG
jgi:hypothetical protein